MRVAVNVVIAMARLRRHKPDNTSRRSTAEATPLAKDRISESCIAVPQSLGGDWCGHGKEVVNDATLRLRAIGAGM